ncbi:hypothetical protein A3K73_04505 [Candidatus Pacearchaeota archaeon RBG_13_36_9]|nr:MAG: hypothetical protein A3K73_04505 [Candidatus Pacearchaeota archaeon RBG_13_36_9]
MSSYDFIGDIAIVKFSKENKKQKKKFAEELLKRKNIKTVLEKADRVKGRLRIAKLNFIEGENKRETLHKENGCRFLLNVESCYFSPRLSEDRKYVAGKVKKNERVLVMFGGVAPYAIAIAKLSKAKEIVSVEISKECSKYARKNVGLNKTYNVDIIQGDVKRKLAGEFDLIVMARPNLKETFLKYALAVAMKGTKIYYHCFCHQDELARNLERLKEEAKKEKRKIKIIGVRKTGDIAPYKFRYGVEIKVLD